MDIIKPVSLVGLVENTFDWHSNVGERRAKWNGLKMKWSNIQKLLIGLSNIIFWLSKNWNTFNV